MMQVKTAANGRKYVSWDDGGTSFRKEDVARALAGETWASPRSGSKPRKRDKDCKVVDAVTMHGTPVYDICDDELIPIAQELIVAMMSRKGGETPAGALLSAADRAGTLECCDEPLGRIGKELARVIGQEMGRQRLLPSDFLAMMPPEVAAVWALRQQQDPDADVADPVSTAIGGIWDIVTDGIVGGYLGFKTTKNALGTVVGAVTSIWAGQQNDGTTRRQLPDNSLPGGTIPSNEEGQLVIPGTEDRTPGNVLTPQEEETARDYILRERRREVEESEAPPLGVGDRVPSRLVRPNADGGQSGGVNIGGSNGLTVSNGTLQVIGGLLA